MHQRRLIARLVVVLVTVTAALTACGSSDDSDSVASSATVDGTVVAVGTAPLPGDAVGSVNDAVGSISDAVEVAAGAPAQAEAAACGVDRQTIETAVELFAATTGAAPTSEQDLVDAGILHDVTAGWDLAADGSIVPAPGGACL